MSNQEQPQSRPNPHIAEPNPYAEYAKKQEQLAKEHPELQEFGRLCYSTLVTYEDGKKMLDQVIDRFLMKSLVHPTSANAADQALYWTGWTDCVKFLKQTAHEHQQRITACQD